MNIGGEKDGGLQNETEDFGRVRDGHACVHVPACESKLDAYFTVSPTRREGQKRDSGIKANHDLNTQIKDYNNPSLYFK